MVSLLGIHHNVYAAGQWDLTALKLLLALIVGTTDRLPRKTFRPGGLLWHPPGELYNLSHRED